MQHMIVSITRIDNDRSKPLVAEHTPCPPAALERPRPNKLSPRPVRILHNADIIDQNFTRVQQTEDKLVPRTRLVTPWRRIRNRTVTIRLPNAVYRLIARRPRRRTGIVRIRIPQLQTRSKPIRIALRFPYSLRSEATQNATTPNTPNPSNTALHESR